MPVPSLLFCTIFCAVSSLICLSSASAAANDDPNSIESKSPTGFGLLELKTALLSLKISELESRLEKLQENSVPLGFVYIQLPNQFSPDVIWPQANWTDVTKEYQGLFFRAEGGGSAAFGSTQESRGQHQTAHAGSGQPVLHRSTVSHRCSYNWME